MKKKSSKMATGMAIGVAAGVTLGALGAMKIPEVANSKFVRQSKKAIRKNAGKMINTAQSIVDSIPRMLS
ncbi:MAG: hypothetical protein IJ346_01760 [Clostridia bacterium]|jgi:gas vesicle protein|nr:hypothetical protein [Clostridia bacterium]